MTNSILKKEIHAVVARAFYNGLINRTTTGYFFLGKTTPWAENDDTPIPATPDYIDEYNTRNNMISLRRVLDTEVSFALTRQDWETNRVYDMYDTNYSLSNLSPSGSASLISGSLFVLTDEFNVYKCISNNYGSVSTVKPTGNSLSYITTSDGYIWKFMMPMSILSQGRFLSSQFMPVQNSISDNFFSPGLSPILVDSGIGYVEDNTLIQVIGDGSGAIFEPVIDGVNGALTNVNVISAGSGYSQAQIVVSTPNPLKTQGSGALIEVDLNVGNLSTAQSDIQLSAVDGELSFVYVESNGSGFVSPTATIIGDGINAVASVNVVDGSIVSIDLINRGSGYTNANVVITDTAGINASARVIISPIGGHGRNIVEESYSDILAFYMDTTDDNRQGFDLVNDYRQSGIITNPDQYATAGSRRAFKTDRATAAWVVNYTSLLQTLLPDAIITRNSDNIDFVVVQVDSTNNKIMLQNLVAKDISVGDVFRDSSDSNALTVTGVLPPEVDKFSGDLIYYDNKSPYRENEGQTVVLKTYIEF